MARILPDERPGALPPLDGVEQAQRESHASREPERPAARTHDVAFSSEPSVVPANAVVDGVTLEGYKGPPKKMPVVGLGTWTKKSAETASPDEALKTAVIFAVKEGGCRHIDCAPLHGNEVVIGEALKELIDEGVVTRDQMWITSKLESDWSSRDTIRAACEKTIRDLQCDYLDLYLMHWPIVIKCEDATLTPTIETTWKGMEALYDNPNDKVRSIGVSNFSSKKLRALKEDARVPIAVNQVEIHPLWRQKELISTCEELGTHVMAYSPLGSPDSMALLTHGGMLVMKHDFVTKVADEVGKKPAQVLVRWAMQRGLSVVPHSTDKEEVKELFDVFNWKLTEPQMVKLSSINRQARLIHGTSFCDANGQYKTPEQLWDGPSAMYDSDSLLHKTCADEHVSSTQLRDVFDTNEADAEKEMPVRHRVAPSGTHRVPNSCAFALCAGW